MSIESVSDIKNIPVVTLREGSILGLVSRIYVDPDRRRLSGVAFKRKMMSPRKYVPASAIRRFGRDVVLIEAESNVYSDGDVPDTLEQRFKDLRKTDVATTGGDVIGAVSDLEVRAEDGTITRLEMTDGRSIDLEHMDVAFGTDHVVVREDQIQHVEPARGDRQGMLSRLFQPDD